MSDLRYRFHSIIFYLQMWYSTVTKYDWRWGDFDQPRRGGLMLRQRESRQKNQLTIELVSFLLCLTARTRTYTPNTSRPPKFCHPEV